MSRLACLFVFLAACKTSAPAPTTLANQRQAPPEPQLVLEPINTSGDLTKQIYVDGFGLVTIGLAGNQLVRVDGTSITPFTTLPDGFDYMIDPVLAEDARGDFTVVGSRSNAQMITTSVWTFSWDRARERFTSRAPEISQRPNICEVCDG